MALSIRLQPNAPLVPIIIGLNIIVFVFWQISPELTRTMAENFTVSWADLMAGKYWVLITPVFSHNLTWHLMVNMLVLYSFGTLVERVLGSRRFLFFYILAGIISSFAHAAVSNFIMDSPHLPALGASGAVAGVLLLFALTFPREKILLFAIIPIPALIGALGFVAIDLWGLMAQAQGGGLPIGHGAHLGGALTGVLYFYWWRSTLRSRGY